MTTAAERSEELRQRLERRFVAVEETLTIAGTEFDIVRPRSAEDLISEADFEKDERLPYWADIWPSSVVLTEWMLNQRGSGLALELGCGVGLVTCAALRSGYSVIATDYYPDALEFTRLNALLNTGREPEVRHLDWRDPPADLPRAHLVFASDVLYERPYAAAVASAIAQLLAPDGSAVVADPGRAGARDFEAECAARGLEVTSADRHEFREGAIRQTITLYSLAPSASSRRAFTSTPQR